MPSVFLAPLAPLVVILHAASAVVLIGSATHHAFISIGYVRCVYKVRLGRIYAAIVAVTWLITFVLGLLAYPTFRYSVRALYMDRHAPWASMLFDIKENCAAVGIPLVVGVFLMSRVMQPKEDRSLAVAYAAMVVLTSAIVWFDVFAGLLITLVKGV